MVICPVCGNNGCNGGFGIIDIYNKDQTVSEATCGTCVEAWKYEKSGKGKPKGLNSLFGITEAYIKKYLWHLKYFILNGCWSWFQEPRWGKNK